MAMMSFGEFASGFYDAWHRLDPTWTTIMVNMHDSITRDDEGNVTDMKIASISSYPSYGKTNAAAHFVKYCLEAGEPITIPQTTLDHMEKFYPDWADQFKASGNVVYG